MYKTITSIQFKEHDVCNAMNLINEMDNLKTSER